MDGSRRRSDSLIDEKRSSTWDFSIASRRAARYILRTSSSTSSEDEDSNEPTELPLPMHRRLRKHEMRSSTWVFSIASRRATRYIPPPSSSTSSEDEDSNEPAGLPLPKYPRLTEHKMKSSTWVFSMASRRATRYIPPTSSSTSSEGEDSNEPARLSSPIHRKQVVRPEVKWEKTSQKHHLKLSKLVKLLKTRPSKATRIGIYRVCFENEYCIGNGSDGTKVYVGISDDGYEVAVKCMKFENGQKLGDNEREMLNYPNVRSEKHIVNYRFYNEVEDSKKAYLVLDLHEESLQDYVLADERLLEQLQNEGPRIMRQILYGIKALHCSNPEILHRDLKPSNILVNCEGEMVLTDFGISRILPQGQRTYESVMRGTAGWMAAESLPTKDDDDSIPYADIQVRYKKQSDIQVVGMLFHYILTKGKHPFGARFFRNFKISKGDYDLKKISGPCARDLIEWMIQSDPYKRPSVDECLKHPYLRTPEENFNLVVRVGNEREIKTNDATSTVVQDVNNLSALKNWSNEIDACVMTHVTARGRFSYSGNVTDLLRFIRNMAIHWHDRPPPLDVQQAVINPQEYFQGKFPYLSVELHRIIRKKSDWKTRDGLREFF